MCVVLCSAVTPDGVVNILFVWNADPVGENIYTYLYYDKRLDIQ